MRRRLDAAARRAGAPALAAACVGLAFALVGCGGSSPGGQVTPVTQLEREDFISVFHALAAAEPSVIKEIAATRSAWGLVTDGLPSQPSAGSRLTIQAAAEAAQSVPLPSLFGERRAAQLTGPGSGPVGLFRAFTGLSKRGWQLIVSSLEAIEHGSPAAARFARANVALYIDSVYDAHFSAAQIGKRIVAGYKQLGGETAFGWRLTDTEVEHLAAVYSEAQARLRPHVGVRLGS